ncbi:hypothetical protein BV898_19639 [Hypsibius exemplaris]|uniref:Uncharacterized protein n=1 Tax=Hypsibius exemplaris TaxID=2072580 RepID=A0A9X6RPZ1_HYPEX|nr:hypothetical protein BV898_19639 [Hypsibius exemplaris]
MHGAHIYPPPLRSGGAACEAEFRIRNRGGIQAPSSSRIIMIHHPHGSRAGYLFALDHPPHSVGHFFFVFVAAASPLLIRSSSTTDDLTLPLSSTLYVWDMLAWQPHHQRYFFLAVN